MTLTTQQMQGYVSGDKFIVHKNPEHFFRLFGGVGANAGKLSRAFKRGAKTALIFFYPKPGITELYKIPLYKWLEGIVYKNKTQSIKGLPEIQKIISFKDCEKK